MPEELKRLNLELSSAIVAASEVMQKFQVDITQIKQSNENIIDKVESIEESDQLLREALERVAIAVDRGLKSQDQRIDALETQLEEHTKLVGHPGTTNKVKAIAFLLVAAAVLSLARETFILVWAKQFWERPKVEVKVNPTTQAQP